MSVTTDSQIINQVLTRGVSQVLPSSSGLIELMAQKRLRVYLGIDPTGSLLTLGHSVVLRKLQQFAELGHEVILLIGNGTVRIGDPTGRDSTRPVLTDEVIQENFKNWQAQASKILDFSKIEIRYNGDWLDKLTYADMIKLMAQTTVQQLIERDMFQDRLQKGLPIHGHEIMYPLLQGYDSVAMDVDLELGGTDQTFNMMMGRHLQKVYNNREKWVLTTPIINGTDGRKMSKSFGNFVALTEAPNDMFGKLMSIADDQIIEYFTLLTDVPMADIEAMATSMQQGANPMEFKKRLAHTLTSFYHDTAAADAAQAHFEQTVQKGDLPADMPEIVVAERTARLLDVLRQAWPEETNSNWRRLIEQGGVELIPSGEKPSDPNQTLDLDQVNVIRAGKRRYIRIKKA